MAIYFNGKNVSIPSGSIDGYTKSEVKNLLQEKQDLLTFDTVPTANSKNPVTSDGIKNAIAASASKVYSPKGSCATASLPTTGQIIGDVWNLTDAGAYGAIGTNVFWNGTKWSVLGSGIDLSAYYTKTECDDSFNNTFINTPVAPYQKGDLWIQLDEITEKFTGIIARTSDKAIHKNLKSFSVEGKSTNPGTQGPTNPTTINKLVADDIVWLSNSNLLHYDLGNYLQKINTYYGTWSSNTFTIKGLTFTYDSNLGTITVNGTATDDITFNLTNSDAITTYTLFQQFLIPQGTFYVSGCPTGGSTSTYWIDCISSGASNRVYDYGSGSTFESTGAATICQIHIHSGTVCSNLVFKPQIEFGNSKTTYMKPSSRVYKLGNDVYLYDTLDFTAGKITVGHYIKTFDGTETFTVDTTATGYDKFSYKPSPYLTPGVGICTHFTSAANLDDKAYTEGAINTTDTSDSIIFLLPKGKYTATTFKDWLKAQKTANTPVQVLYKIQNTEEIKLKDISMGWPHDGANTVYSTIPMQPTITSEFYDDVGGEIRHCIKSNSSAFSRSDWTPSGVGIRHANGAETFNNYNESELDSIDGVTYNTAIGQRSHAEGMGTIAYGDESHAEGLWSEARGNCSHAEGESFAQGQWSHAENNGTAKGSNSHAEGYGQAIGEASHAEGASTAKGSYSHSSGDDTIATEYAQTVIGKYNVEDTAGSYAFILGNGSSDNRSNALTIDWNGNVQCASVKTLDGASIFVAAKHTHTIDDILNFPTIPSKTSQLTNDSGFLTTHQDISGKANSVYVDSQDTATLTSAKAYTDSTIASLVNGAPDTLDTLKELADAVNTAKSLDDAINNALATKADKATTLAGYSIGDAYTKTEIDTKLTSIKVTCDTTPIADSTNPVTSGGVYTALQSAGVGKEGTAVYSELHGATQDNTASGKTSYAGGTLTKATGQVSTAIGRGTIAAGFSSLSVGGGTTANGAYQTVIGKANVPDTTSLFIIGNGTINDDNGEASSPSNAFTVDTNGNVVAKGTVTANGVVLNGGIGKAGTGISSEIHGDTTSNIASEPYSLAEGYKTTASGTSSHAEGATTIASGNYSHTNGLGTSAKGQAQTAIGIGNIEDTTSLFIIGNGAFDSTTQAITSRSNALAVDASGNLVIAGALTASNVYTKTEIDNLLKGKANATVKTSYTLTKSKWASGVYSFEDTYPIASYDIEIDPSSSMTDAQYAAWRDADITGSTDVNTIKARGTVPTIDLPVILRTVKHD